MSIRFIARSPGTRSPAEVACSRSLNLLAHAQLLELEIGSRCGGFGECGGDRVKVTRGGESLSEVTDAEREHLSEEEIAEGYRLACQCFPEGREGENPAIELVVELSLYEGAD